MTQTLSAGLRARVALDRHGFRTTHSLGQNFLLDDHLLSQLLDAAEVGEGDRVLEIGPGAGVMTALLAARSERVLAVEVDERLEPVLRDVLSPFSNVRVVYADFLKADASTLVRDAFGGRPYRVVANLPYYITADILTKLVLLENPPERIAIMVQKEAAERILSEPGQKSWCALAALIRCYGRARVLEEVPPEAFEPAPHVTSCFLSIERYDAPIVRPDDQALFRRVIYSAFAMRRKTLSNNLKSSFGLTQDQAREVLAAAGVPEKTRGEALNLDELCRVSSALGRIMKGTEG